MLNSLGAAIYNAATNMTPSGGVGKTISSLNPPRPRSAGSIRRQSNRQARRSVSSIDDGIRRAGMLRRSPASNTMFDLSTGPSRISGAATSGVGKYERKALRMSKMRRMGQNFVDSYRTPGGLARAQQRRSLPSLDDYLNG